MSFSFRDIRPAMDVYTLDNVYLGVVLKVVPGPRAARNAPEAAAPQSSLVNGELLGPAPTQMIGNRGPMNQSARAHFAVGSQRTRPIGRGALEVGRWFGLVGRRTIPMDDVQTVSLERVVLNRRRDDLDRS